MGGGITRWHESLRFFVRSNTGPGPSRATQVLGFLEQQEGEETVDLRSL